MILCWIFGHRLFVVKHIKGDHMHQTWVALFGCHRCKKRYIMSEPHEAFLRYDNDVEFAADILTMYGEVSETDLLK